MSRAAIRLSAGSTSSHRPTASSPRRAPRSRMGRELPTDSFEAATFAKSNWGRSLGA